MMPWQFPDGRVLLFAKSPVRGRVKTRLRRKWGATGARQVYLRLFRQTLDVAVTSGVAPVEIWCAPGCNHPWVRARARNASATLRTQPPGNLGARMYAALRQTLQEAPYAVIIGADCAALTPGHLHAAMTRLAAGDDAVFAPADDGGYVLVGLRRAEPAVFRNVPWGSGTVMAATRQRLRHLGWRWSELDPVPDVDRPVDVHRLRRAGLLTMW